MKAALKVAPPTQPVSIDSAQVKRQQARCVALAVTLHSFGNSRKVSAYDIDTDADRDWLRLKAKLINVKELAAIESKLWEAKSYVAKRSLPATMIKDGVYLIPLEFVEEIKDRLEEYKAEVAALVDVLIAGYAGAIEEAQKRLGTLFEPSKYPSPEALRRRFWIELNYIPVGTPEVLREVSEDVYNDADKNVKEAWAKGIETINELLASELSELVDRAVDRLTLDDKDKKKRFHESLLKNIRQYFETFDPRNIGDNAELKQQVERTKSALEGVNVEALRQSRRVRESVLRDLTKVKANLSSLMKNRVISFEDV